MAKRLKLAEVRALIEQSSSDNDESDDDIEDDDYESSELEDLDTADNTQSEDDAADDDSEVTDDDSSAVGWRDWSDSSLKVHPFTVQRPGIQFGGPNVPENELAFFQLFFTDELLSEIVAETNRYATEKLRGRQLAQQSIWRKWTDVTLEEMKAYFGLILNMGLNAKADVKHYFSSQWIDYQPFFGDVFSRNRFLQIHWMLHVSPPVANPGVLSRGCKVKNVVAYLKPRLLQHFIPSKEICVDESTVSFKGRVAWKMYNPQKPTKWGLRVYTLCDSQTGYVCAFEPYYGAATTDQLPYPNHQFAPRVVLHLIDQLLQAADGTGYHLFTDRYYTGCILAEELYKRQVHLTGTIMKNRAGLPVAVKKKLKLKQQETKTWVKGDSMTCLVWQDKRQVLMLSTYYNGSVQEIERRTKKGPEKVSKPTMIIDYTQNMGGVDRADHYISSYAFMKKSLKWWRKLFYWILEVAVVNSFILFQQSDTTSDATHLQYRRNLISLLVGDIRNQDRSRKGRPSTMDREERLNKKPHFPDQLPDGKLRDCAVCSNRKVHGGRRQTVYICKTCTRKPGLHPSRCFEIYHTVKDYKPSGN